MITYKCDKCFLEKFETKNQFRGLVNTPIGWETIEGKLYCRKCHSNNLKNFRKGLVK